MTNLSIARNRVGQTQPQTTVQTGGRTQLLTGSDRPGHRWRVAACALVATMATVVLLVRAALLIPQFNNMVDEPYHVVSAVALWDLKTYAVGFQQPPLTRYPAMLALHAMDVHLADNYKDTRILNDDQVFSLSPKLLFGSKVPYEKMLFTARYAMLFWPAVAMLFLYLLTRWLAGDVAAASAVVLFSLDPTFLAHCAWVGTEPGIVAMYLGATYFGLRWILRQSWPSAIGAGIFLGLGIGAKFTCLFLLPGLGMAWLIRPWLMQLGGWMLAGGMTQVQRIRTAFQMAGSPQLVTASGSGSQWNRDGGSGLDIARLETSGSVSTRLENSRLDSSKLDNSRLDNSRLESSRLGDTSPALDQEDRSPWDGSRVAEPAKVSPNQGIPAGWGGRRFFVQAMVVSLLAFVTLWGVYFFAFGPIGHQKAFAEQPQWKAIPQWVKDTPIPMPSFFLGMLRAVGHGRYGHPAFLDGEFSMHGWARYFPEALLMKLPVATLVGLVIAAIAQLFMLPRLARLSTGGRHRLALTSLLVILPFASFMAMAMDGTIDIGIRHILPIMPLVIILVVAPLARMGRIGMGIIAVLACMTIVETGLANPNYIAFFNPIAGGMTGGQDHFLDSNLDWGQDFKAFSEWAEGPEAHGRQVTSRLFVYPQHLLYAEYGLDQSMQNARPAGLFAISINVKKGLIDAEPQPDGRLIPTTDYSWLKDYPLVKRIGGSIEVYDLDHPTNANALTPPQMPIVQNGFNVDGSQPEEP